MFSADGGAMWIHMKPPVHVIGPTMNLLNEKKKKNL